MQTIVGILTLMSMMHFMLSCAEHEKSLIISEPYVSDGKLILLVKI